MFSVLCTCAGVCPCVSPIRTAARPHHPRSPARPRQRVYGISFPDKKLMTLWEKKMQRQAEMDHRRIGTDNKLFMFHELSPGSCFFMPHGARASCSDVM